MRWRTISFGLLCIGLALCAAAKDATIDELRRALRRRAPKTGGNGIRIAQQQLHNADKLYDEGKIAEARRC